MAHAGRRNKSQNKNSRHGQNSTSPSPDKPWISLAHTFIKTIFVTSSISLLALISYQTLHGHHIYPTKHSSSFNEVISIGIADHNCSLPTARYDISTGRAACYPSSGGIWMTELSALELQYLNINRLNSSERSRDRDEENHFCEQLRPFGGSWYPSHLSGGLWIDGRCSELHKLEPAFSVSRRIGYPGGGGVWGLDRELSTSDTAVRNALTMEERCIVLEKLGAIFCRDMKCCSALTDLSKEAHELVEERMRSRNFQTAKHVS
ncbi:hypothetical protein BDV27DRAFT_129645 [Aspergillus caelatus]|uniref:Uncharacterized protein n=1 Tax=Aspergillus caelatus TaxID=61420 RepID=A0A5N7A396_9EURO|nr:uncharacterized protein BDV27DRAFT_129645 [Aspergillus caelatus]KAE8363659.1 hypothetical protein BDV27DRAFT_129645 [Aspergillus caelatus]